MAKSISIMTEFKTCTMMFKVSILWTSAKDKKGKGKGYELVNVRHSRKCLWLLASPPLE